MRPSNARTGSGEPGEEAGTRGELLEAALRLFVERGYAGATIDDVAEAAGYTKGAFYWHFQSKENLLVEVYDAWTREGVANLRAALRESDPGDRARALDAWHAGDPRRGRQWVLFELEVLRLAAQKPELAERLRDRQREVTALLGRALEEELRFPDGEALSAREVATLLSALSDGLLQHRLLDPAAVRGLFGKVLQRLLGSAG